MQKDPQAENTGLKDIIGHAKEYGFVFGSSEIYERLSAVYDYGPYGVELKNNLKQLWWLSMTRLNANIVGLDSSIFMHPKIWEASGHIDSFNDPMIDNLDSKKRYRADVLIEERAAQYAGEGQEQKALELLSLMAQLLKDENLDAVRQLIIDEKIGCPVSKTANWTAVKQFNLMFGTRVGAVAQEADQLYLRPETAQGIFVNFLNVQKSARQKVPFGIAQIGKAFRNEIVARQFIFRMREFEQMEMQFFVRPGTETEYYEHWKQNRMAWHRLIGLEAGKLRFHDHEKLAHYASAATDIEYDFPFGFKEMEGIHSRTDFDLAQHQKFSGKKLQYFDNEINQNYVPYVIETSVGADRLFLAVLCQAYTHQSATDAQRQTKERTYLALHPALAPVKAAILPLIKKDGLPEKAEAIYKDLRADFNLIYEERDSVGKRYTRQDLIGTPFCIVIDHQTLEDDTVTIRDRDTTIQHRIHINAIREKLSRETSFASILNHL